MRKSLFALAALLLISETAMTQEILNQLAPPAGATPIGKYKARGVQIYDCIKGGQWTFRAPEAMLLDANGNLFGKHYAGPTWEAADGSKIVGKVMVSVPAPTAKAIPWLLLSVQPSGGGALANARFVQRINTEGGIGPTGICEDPGMEARSDYSADYIIYR
jgi:hypothetical protein